MREACDPSSGASTGMSSGVRFGKCFRQSGDAPGAEANSPSRHRNRLSDSAVTTVSACSFRTTLVGAGIFFIGYLLLEIPGTLIVERWSARRWLARIMVTWGVMATLSGFAGMLPVPLSVRAQFYWLRFLPGAAEAGFFPGVAVYLSHWFRLADRSRAKAWFMIAQPLSIVIGLPISRWILETVHWHGLEGWRWNLFRLDWFPIAEQIRELVGGSLDAHHAAIREFQDERFFAFGAPRPSHEFPGMREERDHGHTAGFGDQQIVVTLPQVAQRLIQRFRRDPIHLGSGIVRGHFCRAGKYP